MSNHHAHGSSLLQARGERLRRHNHMHLHKEARDLNRKDVQDHHHHHHHRSLQLQQHRRHLQQHNQHVRSYAESAVTQQHRRQLSEAANPVVTQVVQTVSVIQYVDGSGLPLAVSTILAPLLTQIVDPITGVTLDVPVSSPTLSTTALDPIPTSSVGGGTGTSPLPTEPLSSSSTLSSQPPLSVTSAHSTSSPVPVPSGLFNSTSSIGLFNNSTLRTPFSNSTSSLLATARSSSLSETLTTSTFSTSASPKASITSTTSQGVVGDVTGSGDVAPATPTSTSGGSSDTPAFSPATTGALVGGVVGGICGVALIVLALFYVLRWRRQQGEGRNMISGGDRSGKGFSAHMSERGIPFAVPAALAALNGSKKNDSPPAESQERGFVRVSGRKLPSVLKHGGDGYSNPFDDPRESHMSTGDQSVMYRDSEQFFSPPPAVPGGRGVPGSPGSRLKLGSPMRPESGIPVIQPGPARTPVQEDVPKFTGGAALQPPASPLRSRQDPIGRSLPSQDGSRASRGSQSRFTENIS